MKHCYYCGVQTTTARGAKRSRLPDNYQTKDHLLPKSRGGAGVRGNTVVCCNNCNMEKGCLTVEEYRVVWALRKQLVTVADTKVFAGETIIPGAIRSILPIAWRDQLKVAMQSAAAMLTVFVITSLVPEFVRRF